MTDNTNTFCANLCDRVLKEIAGGQKCLIIWGFNETAITLLHRLRSMGLAKTVSAIIDTEPTVQGQRVGHLVVQSPQTVREVNLDTLVITVDEKKEDALRAFAAIDSRLPRVVIAGVGHLKFDDPDFQAILQSCMVSSRAAGYSLMLVHIYQSFLYIKRRGLSGAVAEFGVYKAGTTVFLAKLLHHLGMSSEIYAFDTFAGFPPRQSLFDLYEDPHDEFHDFVAVEGYCKPYDIHLIHGDITKTYTALQGKPLVFSFFDTDNYTPTKRALEMCIRQTVSGGVLAFDHIFCDERWLYTMGERMAAKELLSASQFFNLHGTGIFIRI